MIYDVTLPLSPSLARWPGDPAVAVSSFGEQIKVSQWTLGSHAGTHVDAPTHFSAGPTTVDELDPAILLGPCLVLDLPNVTRITAADLAGHSLAEVTRVLLRTRNSAQWAQQLTMFDEEFVGLDLSAVECLLDSGVRLIGVDGLSIEPYGGDGQIHQRCLRAGVIILEGLNLGAVSAGAYDLICAPLKLVGSDGAPARVWLIGA
ncbi:MAG TPA: cyclase family protein [Armatimonadota bacterium]|jgi:arylformamidase